MKRIAGIALAAVLVAFCAHADVLTNTWGAGRSVKGRSAAVDVPDFTRGAWKNAVPFAPETFDPSKLGLKGVGDVGEQQKV